MSGTPNCDGRAAERGCRCGAGAFRARAGPEVVVYCHCRDCRRSSGVPTVYESSPGVRRPFCGTCGSPISFEDDQLPGETYLPGGVFDAPEALVPGSHDWVSLRLPGFDVADGPPRHERSSVSGR